MAVGPRHRGFEPLGLRTLNRPVTVWLPWLWDAHRFVKSKPLADKLGKRRDNSIQNSSIPIFQFHRSREFLIRCQSVPLNSD